ncbi:hypothetical protein Tco_0500730 [Tanacetum coccineum]
MLVVMPVDYFKLCDSNDSAFGVDILEQILPVLLAAIHSNLLRFCPHVRFPEASLVFITKFHIFGLRHHRLDTLGSLEDSKDPSSRIYTLWEANTRKERFLAKIQEVLRTCYIVRRTFL